MDYEVLLFLIAFDILTWLMFFILSALYPHRLFNSVFLALGLFLTLFIIVSIIVDELASGFIISFVIVGIILLFVPLMLIFNGITMLKKEGKSLANLLSLILGIVIFIGEMSLIVVVIGNYSMGIKVIEDLSPFLMFVGLSVFYFSFIILLFVLYLAFFQFVPHIYNFEYIIVHGCGLLDGDRISKLLSNRIDKAIKAFHKGKDKAMLICSGGQGSNETISEAKAISNYLIEKGISEDHILLEDKSTTTKENLVFSNEIINSRGGSKKTALVSSNYHIYRCVLLAHELKIKCVGIGAKTALYYWPSAVIREFVAVFLNKTHLIWIGLGYLIVISPFIYMIFH